MLWNECANLHSISFDTYEQEPTFAILFLENHRESLQAEHDDSGAPKSTTPQKLDASHFYRLTISNHISSEIKGTSFDTQKYRAHKN